MKPLSITSLATAMESLNESIKAYDDAMRMLSQTMHTISDTMQSGPSLPAQPSTFSKVTKVRMKTLPIKSIKDSACYSVDVIDSLSAEANVYTETMQRISVRKLVIEYDNIEKIY